ncbi:hypothetical protein DEFR109230_08365 [Deinococcus frigens]
MTPLAGLRDQNDERSALAVASLQKNCPPISVQLQMWGAGQALKTYFSSGARSRCISFSAVSTVLLPAMAAETLLRMISLTLG